LVLPYARIKSDLVSAINRRYDGADVRSVTIPAGGGPKTLGNLAAKYIEVDISEQRMYAFEGGNLKKTYEVSTGLYYPTPTGQFQILNKAANAYSEIFHVFMPWWMAFGYSQELNAYFGFHELPYWLTDDGKKIQRPRERIGTPSTGGCIAFDIGEAKEVYDWADIGMPVIIFN
jgi:lipoprotein-anchoring transpeptidase ErfK/SrfK